MLKSQTKTSNKLPLLPYLFALALTLSSTTLQANDVVMKTLVEDIAKIFLSSMEYIFKNQGLINQKGGDKGDLFGQNFISNIQKTYLQQFNHPFPAQNHFTKTILLQAMVEVLEDNRILLHDPDIGF
jgi:hypothetical protein